MTAHEDHAELVVAEALLYIYMLETPRLGFERRNQLAGPVFKTRAAPQDRDRMVVGDAKEPRLRLLRDAVEWPHLRGAQHRLLYGILRQLQMLRAEQPGQPGDNSSCLPAKQVLQQDRAA